MFQENLKRKDRLNESSIISIGQHRYEIQPNKQCKLVFHPNRQSKLDDSVLKLGQKCFESNNGSEILFDGIEDAVKDTQSHNQTFMSTEKDFNTDNLFFAKSVRYLENFLELPVCSSKILDDISQFSMILEADGEQTLILPPPGEDFDNFDDYVNFDWGPRIEKQILMQRELPQQQSQQKYSQTVQSILLNIKSQKQSNRLQ